MLLNNNTDTNQEDLFAGTSVATEPKLILEESEQADKQSKLAWGEIHTHRDSLDDVFIKLVSGMVNEHGEIIIENKSDITNN